MKNKVVLSKISLSGNAGCFAPRAIKVKKICVLLIAALVSSGCQTTGQNNMGGISPSKTANPASEGDSCNNDSRNIGIIAGGIAAIALRNILGIKELDNVSVAGLGALIGGLIGHEMDVRRCELDRIAKVHKLELRTAEISNSLAESKTVTGNSESSDAKNAVVGLSVSVIDQKGGQFLSNSDKLQPDSESAFRDIARQYSIKRQLSQLPSDATAETRKVAEAEYRKKRILLIGHTDDSGSSKLNADLSERRARAVAKLFYAEGVPVENVFYQGAGETLPIADNHDEISRSKNRRVEIIDTADEKKFQAYLASRQPNVNFYRPALNTGFASVQPSTEVSSSKKYKPATSISSANSTKRDGPRSGITVATDASSGGVVLSSTYDRTASSFNFGGEPATGSAPKLGIGTISYNHGFSLASFNPIKSAQAADEPVSASASCLADRPRVANAVKSLRDDKAIKTSDYLPGLNNAAWAGVVNGHTVALTHVAVLRDGATPTGNPDVLLYRDYDPTKPNQKNRKADFNKPADVNVYRGDKGVLYRVFSAGPVRCMDIVIPNSNTAVAPDSWLYYQKNGQTYRAAYLAHLAR